MTYAIAFGIAAVIYLVGVFVVAKLFPCTAAKAMKLGDMAPKKGERRELPADGARVPQNSAAVDDRIATRPVAHQSQAEEDEC